jgi:hypothetical protein
MNFNDLINFEISEEDYKFLKKKYPFIKDFERLIIFVLVNDHFDKLSKEFFIDFQNKVDWLNLKTGYIGSIFLVIKNYQNILEKSFYTKCIEVFNAN